MPPYPNYSVEQLTWPFILPARPLLVAFNYELNSLGQKQVNQTLFHLNYLNVLKHIRMVANLPQLHNSVHERFCTTFALQEGVVIISKYP